MPMPASDSPDGLCGQALGGSQDTRGVRNVPAAFQALLLPHQAQTGHIYLDFQTSRHLREQMAGSFRCCFVTCGYHPTTSKALPTLPLLGNQGQEVTSGFISFLEDLCHSLWNGLSGEHVCACAPDTQDEHIWSLVCLPPSHGVQAGLLSVHQILDIPSLNCIRFLSSWTNASDACSTA